MKLLITHYLPPLALCLFIFIQSSYPSVVTHDPFSGFDKVLHFSAYGCLGFLFCRLFCTIFKWDLKKLILLSILITTLYGITDEIHQSFVSERSADIYDVLADFCGSIAGVTVYTGIVKRFIKK